MKVKQQPLDAAKDGKGSDVDSDSSDDGDFVPSGSGSGSDSEAADSDISDGEVKKVSADAGDAVQLAAAAGRRATRAAVAAASKRPAPHAPPPAAADDPAKKSRVDALFADLLADDPPLRPRAAVGGIITAAFAASAAPVIKATTPTASASSTSSAIAAQGATATALRPASLPSAMTGAGHKEVTVTTTKDFAGQLVHVTRTVAVGSEEHKKMMQKPKGTGLESVLGLLGKAKKASTMEKSASDWIGFVQKEGIADQLEENRKDGYMEKLCFLDRTASLQTQFIKQGKKAQAEAAAAAETKQL